MVTKVENEKTGLREKKKRKEGDTYKELGSVIKKTERTKDGDGEAGVDPQIEQLNEMPNDPTVQPLDPKSSKARKTDD